MMKIFYATKWILGSFLFLLLLDLVVESAVVAPNQKGNQDGTKLSEQRFLPETSLALNVEEENHAPKLQQISRKRVKRGDRSNNRPLQMFTPRYCGVVVRIPRCNCFRHPIDGMSPPDIRNRNRNRICKENWKNKTCLEELNRQATGCQKLMKSYCDRWLGIQEEC